MRWELMSSEDKDFIFAEAVLRGWAENKVQVKRYQHKNKVMWAIEPYEEGCGCSNLVKYDPNLVKIAINTVAGKR